MKKFVLFLMLYLFAIEAVWSVNRKVCFSNDENEKVTITIKFSSQKDPTVRRSIPKIVCASKQSILVPLDFPQDMPEGNIYVSGVFPSEHKNPNRVSYRCCRKKLLIVKDYCLKIPLGDVWYISFKKDEIGECILTVTERVPMTAFDIPASSSASGTKETERKTTSIAAPFPVPERPYVQPKVAFSASHSPAPAPLSSTASPSTPCRGLSSGASSASASALTSAPVAATKK